MLKGGFVYILTNKHHTTLYTGVTSNIVSRIIKHKEKAQGKHRRNGVKQQAVFDAQSANDEPEIDELGNTFE